MPTCCIVGCRTGYTGLYGKYQTFTLPKSQEMQRHWLEKINRANLIPTKHTVVCERHFRSNDFVPAHENLGYRNKPKKKKTLKPFATPSLYLGLGPTGDNNHDYYVLHIKGMWNCLDF